MSGDDSYEVGYGRPPKHTRFRKGRSGNPRGGPKGAKSFAALLARTLEKPVSVRVDGRQVRVSTSLAALLRLREKALKGDIRAVTQLLSYAEAQQARAEADRADRALSALEREILEGFVGCLPARDGAGERDD